MASKKSGGRRYSKSASNDVRRAMKKRKSGTLRSGGSGKKVTSRKQAIAIGLSEAREKGKKVPGQRSGGKKSRGRKSSGARKSGGRRTSGGRKSGGKKGGGRR